MTTQPTDHHPFWTVQSVYDPDGAGRDFAYTIGLTDASLPELHIWARPSLGIDPGADWRLSSDDCCHLLNELAAMLIRGDLAVGSTLSREYDGGLVRLHLRVDPPGDRDQLEALRVPRGGLVLPVRWSLHREPEGPNAPLGPEQARWAAGAYEELVAALPDQRVRLSGWELPVVPVFEPDQRFGPLTPLVLARANQLTAADSETISAFVGACLSVDACASISYPAAISRTVARGLGRTNACDEVVTAIDDLVGSWRASQSMRKRWREVMADWYDPQLTVELQSTRSRVEGNVESRLRSGMQALLLSQVVQDVLDRSTWLHAAGAWSAAGSPDGRPGPDWHASPLILRAVRQLLARRSATRLLELGSAHRCATHVAFSFGAGSSYVELERRLLGWALVSAAECPSATDLLSGLKVSRELDTWSACRPHDAEALSRWLTCLTVLATHRARVTQADVLVFCEPAHQVLPNLAEWLNEAR